jgi:hypothetical protein
MITLHVLREPSQETKFSHKLPQLALMANFSTPTRRGLGNMVEIGLRLTHHNTYFVSGGEHSI